MTSHNQTKKGKHSLEQKEVEKIMETLVNT